MTTTDTAMSTPPSIPAAAAERAEYENAARWAYCGGPIPTFEQWQVEHAALRLALTERHSAWPTADEYRRAAELTATVSATGPEVAR
jgi:hypothetical protein